MVVAVKRNAMTSLGRRPRRPERHFPHPPSGQPASYYCTFNVCQRRSQHYPQPLCHLPILKSGFKHNSSLQVLEYRSGLHLQLVPLCKDATATLEQSLETYSVVPKRVVRFHRRLIVGRQAKESPKNGVLVMNASPTPIVALCTRVSEAGIQSVPSQQSHNTTGQTEASLERAEFAAVVPFFMLLPFQSFVGVPQHFLQNELKPTIHYQPQFAN